MPDTKITALTALTAADPANDVLPIVDVSDTTMAASGTTKKISINNVLGASGTATLASATISGDLTVRTNQLVVNSSGSFVGKSSGAVGTDGVQLLASGFSGFSASGTTALFVNRNTSDGTVLQLGRSGASAADFGAIAGGGFTVGLSGSEWMRINSTGLGVGVASPATKLDVAGNARVQLAFFTGGSIPGLTNDNPFAYRFPGGGLGLGAATETGTASPIIFYTGQGGVERVRVKGFGQVRFFPLAADPAGAEAGDVYYNSTSNKLKCYNGTTWNDLF